MTHQPTKREAASAVSNLIDEFGTRLVLECVSDYLRQHLRLNLWADRVEAARAELFKDYCEHGTYRGKFCQGCEQRRLGQ